MLMSVKVAHVLTSQSSLRSSALPSHLSRGLRRLSAPLNRSPESPMVSFEPAGLLATLSRAGAGAAAAALPGNGDTDCFSALRYATLLSISSAIVHLSPHADFAAIVSSPGAPRCW